MTKFEEDSTDINLINILGTKTQNVKSLQQKGLYCKHIHNTLHITVVKNKLTVNDNILFKVVQNEDKSFKALVMPKYLALTILVNCFNLQGCAGTNNTYSLIKRD